MRTWARLAVVVVGLGSQVACLLGSDEQAEEIARFKPLKGKRGVAVDGRKRNTPEEEASIAARPSEPATVVLVVMDTVRADHTSLCGYERETTPFLTAFASDKDTAVSCRTYTTGTWTLPTHASFFTGLDASEHGLLSKGRPLDPKVPTLAERFGARGYQTVLVSANPTLAEVSGIQRGFEHVHVAKGMYNAWRRGEMVKRVRAALEAVDADQPLFLVVNIFDAHDPYPAIRAGEVPWSGAQGEIELNPKRLDDTSELKRFVKGELTGEEAEAWLEEITAGYDKGIRDADFVVGEVARLLGAGGFLDEGSRILITSDHGEHLGGHGLVRHDGPPWEGVSRVHLVYRDSTRGKQQPKLPAPLSARAVHDLLLRGRVIDDATDAASAAITHDEDWYGRRDAVAVWAPGGGKAMWIEGRTAAFDVKEDPEELDRLPVPEGRLSERLQEQVEALEVAKAAAEAAGDDAEVMKALREVGYVE